ncbi:MAG: LysM peptidoglycan-binding domain-containing protein [Chloroflexi bacterium]|nr:LysM peptidoglycan-binding domain-containing protein [Chloroflexota bacterium]
MFTRHKARKFTLRHLILFLISLPLFAAPAQAQSNPTAEPCGLPAQGVIVASVIYTLTANCTQTRWLEIKTSETPNITLTINGGGFTITNMTDCCEHNSSYNNNFLLVDDQGELTVQNVDNGRSPNVKVIIKNVTFDGNNKKFRRPRRLQPDGVIRNSATGAGILVDGDLEMENVTFTRGDGMWLRVKGTATLKNVLFEDSWVNNFSFSSSLKGMLYVAKSASVTLDKAVFRDIGRSVIMIDKGGSLSTSGCLSFIRVWTHKVHHSGVWGGFGSWSDKSTGPCTDSDDPIGNKGKAVTTYSLTMLDPDCGLPSSGTIEGTVVYTLTKPCVCVSTVNIAAGANVTINGNGNRIEGCTTGKGYGQFRVGNARLIINNAILHNIRVYNYGGQFTLADSTVRNAVKVPIINYGWAYFSNSRFESNRGDRDSNVYYSHGYFHLGRAIFRDNVFHNNAPGDIEAYTTGRSTAIYLCGENILDGDVPTDVAQFFMAVNGGGIFGCNDNQPTHAPSRVECVPEYTGLPADKTLGAIGIIFHKQKCPPVIEIWEVLPNSQGHFALKVSQNDIEAVAEGLVACSSNGRVAVRVGLTEPVRQKIAHSRAYQAPSVRGGRDILVSIGPNVEGKVIHMVLDHALDGRVLGIVDTRPGGPPCSSAALSSDLFSSAIVAATPVPVQYAAPVFPQPAREDGSIVHVVQPGDTIWQIGIAYDVHPYKIIALNRLDQLRNRGRYIFPGQELLIREPE